MVLMMLLATVLVAASMEPLRTGAPLPPLEGESLTGKSASLPAAGSGKTTLILLGFTYTSRFPVEAWGPFDAARAQELMAVWTDVHQ
jgi:hypothetical protein